MWPYGMIYLTKGACPWDVCVGRGKRDRNFGKKAQNPGKIVEDIKARI